MEYKQYIDKLFQTGAVTSEETIAFLIQHYFLRNLTLDDFKADLLQNYNDRYPDQLDEETKLWQKHGCSNQYVDDVIKCCIDTLNNYVKKLSIQGVNVH